MQLGPTLIAISNDARGWLKAWGSDFTEAEAGQKGGGTANPFAWQLGHLAAAEEEGAKLFGAAGGIVPEAVRAVCASGCPAPTAVTRYPPVAELWAMLERTHGQLLAIAERATEADFDRPSVPKNRFFHTLGQTIYELALHENYHVGEIGTLRKALGKKKIG